MTSFALMMDRTQLELMHQECGRAADPSVRSIYSDRTWCSVATVIDMPIILQRYTNCAWCSKTLDQEADPELKP